MFNLSTFIKDFVSKTPKPFLVTIKYITVEVCSYSCGVFCVCSFLFCFGLFVGVFFLVFFGLVFFVVFVFLQLELHIIK